MTTRCTNLLLGLLSIPVLFAGCARTSSAPGSAEAATPRTEELSVLTYNIWHDRGDWPARREIMLSTLAELDADIIGLQEVLQHTELPNQAETIANHLGYEMFFSTVDPPEREKRYGNAILTRYPILTTSMHKLSPLDDYRTVAHVVIEIDGQPVDIYNTHLHHTTEGGAIRSEQIADLLQFISRTRKGTQSILMGDFNAAPDWPELVPVHERYTDTYALFVEDPLSETHATLNPHVGHSQRRIDHIFLEKTTSPPLTPLRSTIVLNEPGPGDAWPSDHFGVLTRFRVGL